MHCSSVESSHQSYIRPYLHVATDITFYFARPQSMGMTKVGVIVEERLNHPLDSIEI